MPFVKPREGYSIRDPERRDILPADRFREVPVLRYWHRLRSRGDVLMLDAAPPEQVEGYEGPTPKQKSEPEQKAADKGSDA